MKNVFAIITNSGQYVLTLVQTNEVFQLVELILSIIMTLFIIVVNVISWYKKAKKDGKIDEEELEELKNIIEDGKENFKK